MRRPGIALRAAAVQAAVIVAAVGIMGFGAARVLRRLGNEQALARVEAAGSSLSHAVAVEAADLRTSARLLGERPTLRRLLREEALAPTLAFLSRFAETGDLDGWAIFRDGEPAGASEHGPEWESIPLALGEAGSGLVSGGGGRPPWSAALAPVVDRPGISVVVARRWDDRRVAALAETTGAAARILDAETASGAFDDPALTLRLAALGGEGSAARVEAAGAFIGTVPLRSPSGAIIAVGESLLEVDRVDAPILRLARRITWLALAAAAIGALVAGWSARATIRPVEDLTRAAVRIGNGDLGAPVPREGVAEIGRLASSMDEMRIRLQALTVELKRQQAEAESILAGTADGVLAVDRERRVRYLNPQAARRIGVDPEAALGRFCGDLLRPRERDGHRPCEERCPILDSRFRGPARAVERLETTAGIRSVMVTSAPPVESGTDDDSSRQIVVLRDETDAEAARRLRDAVVANVSHEFRTPLSAQRAALELVRERLGGSVDAAPLLRSLERGTSRLTRLIDNLLESLRIEAGQDGLRRERVDLDEVLDGASEEMAPLLELRGQRLDVALPHPFPSILGDPVRLSQVFVNLIANAHKFGPDGSTISVRGEVRRGEVAVTVSDEGPGLPAGDAERLFERFVRAEAEEPAESGLGLGLWIVRSIVTRHGGRVEILDSGPGTRIAVVLPTE